MDWNTFQILERSLRWYRGLSAKQFLGCNNLLHSLRDDIAQESTYRVHECLRVLGLSPMISSKQIKNIISLSQCNDLAFLWFTWEAFYKQPQDCVKETTRYTVNEQLLLTAIMHLDMMTTMRALDDLLPKYDHSKKSIDMQQARELKQQQKSDLAMKQRERQLERRGKMSGETEGINFSPYLVPQPRPKPFAPSSLTTRPKSRKMIFTKYEKYRDRLYNIPNESSRWFATYELSPVKREIKRCLSEVLNQIFGDKLQKAEPAQCNVHRMVGQSLQLRQQELLVETMRRYMGLMDVEGSKRERLRKHIVRRLEEDVNNATHMLREYARKQLKKLKLIAGNNCSGGVCCDMWKKLVMITPETAIQPRPDFSFILDREFVVSPPATINTPVLVTQFDEHGRSRKLIYVPKGDVENNADGVNAYCQATGKCPPTDGLISVLNDQSQILEFLDEKLKKNSSDKSAKKIKKGEGFCFLNRANAKENVSKLKELKSPDSQINNGSQYRYFSQKTLINGFPQWDYFKIYEPPLQRTQSKLELKDAQATIKGCCLSALQRPMKKNESMRRGDKPFLVWKNDNWPRDNMQPMDVWNPNTTTDAAEKCALDMCKEAANDSISNHNSAVPIIETFPKIKENKLSKITYIDPNNRDQIIDLLKIAMEIMQMDPKYVLVTLPNAHMIPELVDWVAERYGRTYDIEEICRMDQMSANICYRLLSNGSVSNIPYPNWKSIDMSSMSYSELVFNINKLRAAYNRGLNDSALEEARLLWLALRGYSNLGGCLEETFFAYLPAKEADLKRSFVWKSTDFRNAEDYRFTTKKNNN